MWAHKIVKLLHNVRVAEVLLFNYFYHCSTNVILNRLLPTLFFIFSLFLFCFGSDWWGVDCFHGYQIGTLNFKTSSLRDALTIGFALVTHCKKNPTYLQVPMTGFIQNFELFQLDLFSALDFGVWIKHISYIQFFTWTQKN